MRERLATRRVDYITNLRVFAMIAIVLCHLNAHSSFALIRVSSQFLNVGVQIFFFISGFLLGRQHSSESIWAWYLKRIKKIVVPYYLLLIVLCAVHFVQGNYISIKTWIIQILFLQASQKYVVGAEHLWFLSVLVFCYIVTPFAKKLFLRCSNLQAAILLCVSTVLQVFTAYYISSQIGIYWGDVNLYFVACYYGMREQTIGVNPSKLVCLCALLTSVIVRLIGRTFFDETILYNVFIVGVTQSVIAVAVFWLFKKFDYIGTNAYIRKLDNISYEIYLVHYMFIVGPVSLMAITRIWVVNSILIIIVSVVSAVALNWISRQVVFNSK